MHTHSVPQGLRQMFVIHFIADYLFAIPLFLAPVYSLQLFGWTTIDPLMTRLVAAALFGIGGESLLSRRASLDSFSTMVRLKLIWSLAANVALAMALFQNAPWGVWLFQGIFVIFSGIWFYWDRRLGKLSHK